ncbi:hypothetical protein JQ604_18455 [Bradyrhizobium jicamae]|uniref:hypothetical protein n=1 Tax=Bradyrhizobium jicamae TaxID=280332 RepID=UPI001BAA652F|nr:hypothetical protein [Bradyrhizobium jicamae]MBR0754171.1 hypothetical protein [Bradyrhizobium jicamae]
MRILGVAAVAMLLTAPAYAQMPNINLLADAPSKTQEEKEQDAAKDKAYKDTLRKIPDAKASSDPWGTVRGPDAPKTAAAPAKPKTKTGSTTSTNTQRSQ